MRSDPTSGAAAALRALLLPVVLLAAAAAQDARYELGLRVRAFEREFEPVCGDAAVRARVCPKLEAAVKAFFGVRLAEVARCLDEARRALATAEEVDPAARWADSLSLRLDARLLPLQAETLGFELRATYPVDVELPGARLVLRFVDDRGEELQPPAELAITALPVRGAVPLRLPDEGDHRLVVEIVGDHGVLARHEQTVSLARDLEARLERLADSADLRPDDTTSATRRGLARLLQSLGKGGTREADVQAVRHLRELEDLADETRPRFHIEDPGDFRLWLATPRGTVPARVFVPARPAAAKVPLVVALHGAGGSENMFFDGYGAGKIVGLCRARGWLLAAPRGGLAGDAPVDEVVDALAARYPIDRERVFAVGHSMGAAQLIGFAARRPGDLRAIALLGGGGPARPTEGLRRLPIFLAPGEKDFALPGARRLRDALTAAGAAGLDYREYAATEHLGVVQVALGDVFASFDRAAVAK